MFSLLWLWLVGVTLAGNLTKPSFLKGEWTYDIVSVFCFWINWGLFDLLLQKDLLEGYGAWRSMLLPFNATILWGELSIDSLALLPPLLFDPTLITIRMDLSPMFVLNSSTYFFCGSYCSSPFPINCTLFFFDCWYMVLSVCSRFCDMLFSFNC